MEKAKFNVGDTLVRTAYKNEKSIVLRDEFTITEIVRDDRPFCAQLWYIGIDYKGQIKNGLVGVVDSCFCLKQ